MIYETVKVGGPVVLPLVLSLQVTNNTTPPGSYDPVSDNEGIMNFVSDVRSTITEVNGVNSISDSYVLYANVIDAQPTSYPSLSDEEYAYYAPSLRLYVWDDAGFNDIPAVNESAPFDLIRTGHFKVLNDTHLTVTNDIPNPALVNIDDPAPVPAQSVKRTGMFEWVNRDVQVIDARTLIANHYTISDAEIVTEGLKTHLGTEDLAGIKEQVQYWS